MFNEGPPCLFKWASDAVDDGYVAFKLMRVHEMVPLPDNDFAQIRTENLTKKEAEESTVFRLPTAPTRLSGNKGEQIAQSAIKLLNRRTPALFNAAALISATHTENGVPLPN